MIIVHNHVLCGCCTGSSGSVSYTGLAREEVNEFVLHIQARTTAGEVANLRRMFRIGLLDFSVYTITVL